VLIRNGDTPSLADLLQARRRVERGIAAEAEGRAVQARRERSRLQRVFRTTGKNAFLARGARHILHKSYLQRHRFGYPLSAPVTI
jgi:hypothetical protein